MLHLGAARETPEPPGPREEMGLWGGCKGGPLSGTLTTHPLRMRHERSTQCYSSQDVSSSTHALGHSIIQSIAHSLAHSLSHSRAHSLSHSLTKPFIYTRTHPPVRSSVPDSVGDQEHGAVVGVLGDGSGQGQGGASQDDAHLPLPGVCRGEPLSRGQHAHEEGARLAGAARRTAGALKENTAKWKLVVLLSFCARGITTPSIPRSWVQGPCCL